MFTGIIEHVGMIHAATARSGGARQIEVDLGPLATDVEIGASIACNGVCLTVTSLKAERASFDLSPETCTKTTAASWRVGSRLNLERALAFGDRLGGHLVSGHVDGIGNLRKRTRSGDGEEFLFELPSDGSVRVVEKGSIAIDGISLTCWNCGAGRFSVAVIPHTLTATTLADLRAGSGVNMEQDPIGRWVEAMAAPYHR